MTRLNDFISVWFNIFSIHFLISALLFAHILLTIYITYILLLYTASGKCKETFQNPNVKYEIVKVPFRFPIKKLFLYIRVASCLHHIKFTCSPGCRSSSKYLLISSSLHASRHTLLISNSSSRRMISCLRSPSHISSKVCS